MANRIATIKGTFATPGISGNGRYFTAPMIAETVAEAQKLIDSGAGLPLTMLTGHSGRRDSLGADVIATAGRVTKVSLSPQGHGLFEADIADTAAGRDVATLTTGGYLKGVSMAGVWKGTPHKVRVDGAIAETADGVSLRGIDFTHSPGITGAHISSAALAESAAPDGLICEELEEVVFVEETDGSVTEAAKTSQGSGETYADPGYQSDKVKRYPLTLNGQPSAKRVRAAWSYINQADNAKPYSATQLARIKSKIKKAAKGLNIDIAEELRLFGNEILEAYASVCLDNGPGTVNVSAYVNEPEKLAAVGRSVAAAALAGLYALDPDTDGDIDAAISEDDDDQMDDSGTCPGCGGDVAADANFCPACGTPIPQGESAREKKGAAMPEATKPEGAVTEDAPITKSQLEEAVAAAVTQTLEAVKAAGEVTESEDLKKARAFLESEEAQAALKTVAEATGATGDLGVVVEKLKPAPVTETAPAAAFSKEDVEKLVTEATEAASKATLEAVRAEVKETVQMSGRRNGLVSKSILEQAPEEIYGENADLSKMSLAELATLTDKVAAPLIGATA